MRASQRERIAEIARELQEIVGGDLVSLVLYGSAAHAEFVEGVSDINFLIVVRGAPLGVLERLRPHWPDWQQKGMAAPLVVGEQFIQRAADVFPIELADIRSCHEVFAGDDVLADIEIRPEHLRRQLEFELRSKWLKLGSLYLQSRELGRAADAILLEAAKSLCILMRPLLGLAHAPTTGTLTEVAEQFERVFATNLSVVRQLLAIRRREAGWPKDREALFRQFLAEVGTLVDVVDRLVVTRDD